MRESVTADPSLKHQMFLADLGPDITAWTGRVAGKLVCVATPQVEHDASVRREVRDLIKRQGVDCAVCRSCLMGRDA